LPTAWYNRFRADRDRNDYNASSQPMPSTEFWVGTSVFIGELRIIRMVDLLIITERTIQMSDDLKTKILDVMEKSSEKGKKKVFIKSLVNQLPDEDKKEIKKTVKELEADGALMYWSSGSTVYMVLSRDFESME